MKKDTKSVLEEIFEGLHIYEYLKEAGDSRLEELIRHFEQNLPEEEFMLMDEMLSRQAAQATDLYPRCFALGARLGFQLAEDLDKEFDIEYIDL